MIYIKNTVLLFALLMQQLPVSANMFSAAHISSMKLQAESLRKAGAYQESAKLYEKVMDLNDSLHGSNTKSQLAEYARKHQTAHHKRQSELNKNRFYGALSVGVLLFIAIGVHIYFVRKLKMKNIALYAVLQSKHEAEKIVEHQMSKTPDDMLTSGQQLYRKLMKLMTEETLFKDEELNRQSLASKLGTNPIYVANAIKECADGISVNDFINRCRLRYAASQLVSDYGRPVGIIADESGFSSRATFSRLFRDAFGMSASEYRMASKEKRVSKFSAEDSVEK